MGAILSLSHFSIYQFFNLFPFSVLQSNMFNVGRKLTRGIVVANLPPSTLQNNTFIVCGKLPRGVILKIYPPPRTFKTIRLIQHMKKVDMLSHCYRFIFRPPTKHFVRHMNRLGILSHVWNVFTFPYNKARRWTNKIGTSSHVWNLRPLDHTQQYIQHMDQVDMLMHSFGFTCPVPYETLCLVYEPAWHLYLCQNVPCLPLHQDNTLNTWKERHLESFLKFTVPRPYKAYVKKNGESWHFEFCLRWKLTRWVFLKIEPPSTLQSKRLNKCRKLTCGVIFAIYNLSSTPQNTKQYL